MRKRKNGQPAEPAKSPCRIALEAAHAASDRIGRTLHPTEVQWVVRHEFRQRYAWLGTVEADRLAERAIYEIRVLTMFQQVHEQMGDEWP